MASDRAWRAALAEHDAVLADARSVIECLPAERWLVPRAANKWSPADEVMHIRLAYSFGVDAVASGAAMRLVVPPFVAWFAGHVLLLLVFCTQRFPRGAVAPPEVRPSPCDALGLTPRDASAQLAVIATHAAAALHTADRDRPSVRVDHTYFGALPPCTALRLLSAHTRHHTAAIRVSRARA